MMKKYFEEQLKEIFTFCGMVKNQTAQIIVLTALLMPLFIAATGLTVDFGNMYIHKAKLQNAADAAAVAAGWNYAKNSGSDENKKSAAQTAADTSVFANAGVNSAQLSLSADGKYLQAVVTETVPVYFLKFFGVGPTASVSAVGYVKLEEGGGTVDKTTDWKKMFYFSENLQMSNGVTIKNNSRTWTQTEVVNWSNVWSNFRKYGIIGTLIRWLGGNSMPRALLEHFQQTTEYVTYDKADPYKNFGDALLGKNTWSKYYNVRQSFENGEPSDIKFDATNSKMRISYAQSAADTIYEYITTVGTQDKGQSQWDVFREFSPDKQYYFEHLLPESYKDLKKYSINYVVKADKYTDPSSAAHEYAGQLLQDSNRDKNKPYYFVMDAANKDNGNKKTIEISGSDSAFELNPVILVYTGKGNLELAIKGKQQFRGIIYAPNANVSVVAGSDEDKKSDDKVNFKGSIVARNIDLQIGTYQPDSITTGGGGGGEANVTLVGLPNGVTWQAL